MCPLWDARVSLAQVLHQVQRLRAWRGGPFNMIAAARHGARCGLHAAQAEAAALELAHRARLVESSAAARENCGTHACERRELLESRRSGPPASAPGRQTCSRSYDVGLLTTGLLAGIHPTKYVAAIMSDTPLAQAHRQASDEAASPAGAVLCSARRSRREERSLQIKPRTFRFGNGVPEIESRKYKRIGRYI